MSYSHTTFLTIEIQARKATKSIRQRCATGFENVRVVRQRAEHEAKMDVSRAREQSPAGSCKDSAYGSVDGISMSVGSEPSLLLQSTYC